MRSKMILLLLTAALFFVVPAIAQEKEPEKPKAPAPHLVIKGLEHDFGEVKPGTPLTFSFAFENQGNDTLRVHSVKASCGCTTTKYDKIIAPEKKGEITLAIADTKTYQGSVVKSATVATNDPDQPTFRLTLRANFKKE